MKRVSFENSDKNCWHSSRDGVLLLSTRLKWSDIFSTSIFTHLLLLFGPMPSLHPVLPNLLTGRRILSSTTVAIRRRLLFVVTLLFAFLKNSLSSLSAVDQFWKPSTASFQSKPLYLPVYLPVALCVWNKINDSKV